MDLAELIRDVEGVRASSGVSPGGDGHGLRVADITEDSRTVMPGSLFVARAGTRTDGRGYIDAAIGAGASAVLTDGTGAERMRTSWDGIVLIADDVARAAADLGERFYGSPGQRLRLAGITGTNGKTTTAHLAHAILNAAGERTGLVGTVSIDDGSEVAASEMTTMPALELSRTLAVMVESGCAGAVLEVSSHALDQGRVSALPFEIAGFTNLTPEHLDYHGTMEAYASAKATLFASLDPGATAVVNADDPWAARMLEGCAAEVIRCTQRGAGDADADVRVLDASIGKTRFELSGPWGSFEASLPTAGTHNGMNLLQASCIAWASGLDASALARGAADLRSPPGRLEVVSSRGDPFAVVVDFAHTDDALRKALEALRGVTARELVAVFGAGGDKDREKRPRMGAVASEIADRLIVTSDNPRTEDPSAIVGEIVRGVPEDKRDTMAVHVDRATAIREAINHARAGDVVLIAGRGHEREQIVSDGRGGTTKIAFDDREVARAALGDR